MDAEPQMTFPGRIVSRELSTIRLHSLKLVYLLTGLLLGISAWPQMINRGTPWDPLHGVAFSFWAAYSTLMLLGVRLPVRMLPLLLLQLFYKLTWLIGVVYPLWSAGHVSPGVSGLIKLSTIAVVVDLVVIPWPYVFEHYVKVLFTLEVQHEAATP
jgi:hypothetical protein